MPTPTEIKQARAVLHDWCGVEVTDDQARELLADPRVASELPYGVMDTCTREALMSALARRVVGRNWPIYGDGREAMEKFSAEMREKAPQLGYKLLPDFGNL